MLGCLRMTLHVRTMRRTPRFTSRGFLTATLLAIVWRLGCTFPAIADDSVQFQRDVQPVLARQCFACHGPDEQQREADLRLDRRDAALEAGAIVPGKPSESEVVRRITSTDPDERMPPPEHGKALNVEQIKVLTEWIRAGAPYERHWSFVPPKPEPPPTVGDARWPRNSIDNFVLHRLEEAKRKPSPTANPYSLVRRLYLDLLGRGPTPAEADAYVHDPDPRAYERLVDRLLSSPQYGERWARPWLDLARYSDTNGYEKDRERSIWPYRDWVIQALNADMPFDQFSIEQLAGDMLPQATDAQRIATGFHRNTMLNEEGGIDPLEFRFYAMVDRVSTTGLVWLGLTTGCAQCHTHKYDPITHTDYYSFMALLNNADEPDQVVREPIIQEQRATIEADISRLEQELPSQFPAAPEKAVGTSVSESRQLHLENEFAKWVEQQKADAIAWSVIRPVRFSTNLPRLELLPDGSLFSTGDITKRDVFDLEFDLATMPMKGNLQGLRLEVLPDERLPAGGPGRAYYEGRKGDFFLSEVSAVVGRTGMPDQPITFDNASHSYGKLSIGSGNADARNVLDQDGSTGWSVSGQEGAAHQLVLAIKDPLPPAGTLRVKMVFERHFAAGLGRFRFSGTVSRTTGDGAVDGAGADKQGTSEWVKASLLPVEVEATLAKPLEAWTKDERTRVMTQFLRTTPHLEEARKRIDQLRAKLPTMPTTMVMKERPADNPRATHRHHRGEYLSAKEPVPPAIPAFLRLDSEPQPGNRLELARWLVSRDNPLAARVAVNRAWRQLWGFGLVRTSGDFGTQSEPPTHPQLLDYLAVELMRNEWSLKWLHRMIVTSSTYRQQSSATASEFAADPTNRSLARGPRFRVDAEVIRDAVLASSDLLATSMGGPSVFPPQPQSVIQLAYGNAQWKESTGASRYRRSLYTFSKRTAPFASYAVFDSPSGETCLARRNRSNTPLQSLTLLNDPMFLEAAKALGRQAAAWDASDQIRTRRLFRQLLTRPATYREVEALTAFFQRQVSRLESSELDGKKIDSQAASPEAVAWGMTARIIMNLDELITKQ